MANNTPVNIIMATYVVYFAPVGTTAPTTDTANPAGPWTVIGQLGAEDYADEGVKVSNDQKIEGFRGAANTGLRKVSRTEEDLMVSFKLADMSLETIAHALNENAISSSAAGTGVAGYKRVKLYQGVDVANLAILVRGYSPYSSDTNARAQLWIPNAYQSGKLGVDFAKGKAALIELEFTAMRNPNAGNIQDAFGWWEAYTAPGM